MSAGQFRMQEPDIRMQNREGPDRPCRAVHYNEPGLVVANRGARFVYLLGYKALDRFSGLSACGLRR
jgi:hypothetical protein